MSFSRWPAPGILALYRLEDVNDSSGNSHTLTNGGTVTFGAGKFGNCALFGNANSSKYLYHSDGLGEDLSGEASVSCWFMVQTLPGSNESQYLLRWGSTTGTARYFFITLYNDGGTQKFRLLVAGTWIDYTITLLTNVWYKLDANCAATFELYLNGVLVASGARGTTTTNNNSIAIGSYWDGSSPSLCFKGNIDEAVFFSAARTAADIRRRYAFERGMLI